MDTNSIFQQIRDNDETQRKVLKQREEEIAQLKMRGLPEKKRLAELKQKAKNAKKFLVSPAYPGYEEYIQDLSIEAQINIRELGLSGKSSQEVGEKVIRLSTMIEVLDRIVNEPKSLLELLK